MNAYLTANAAFAKFSRNYMELKKGLPVRPGEMGVLNILAGTPGPHTPAMLARFLGVSKPMVTATLSSLSEQGYITREQSPTDGRVWYLHLTEKATKLVEIAKVDMNRHLDRLICEMGKENFAKLVALTEQANAILEAEQSVNARDKEEAADGLK